MRPGRAGAGLPASPTAGTVTAAPVVEMAVPCAVADLGWSGGGGGGAREADAEDADPMVRAPVRGGQLSILFISVFQQKITLNWLRHHVDFDWSPDESAKRLTLLGLEVESVEKVGGELDGVVVAQVLSRDKHPNADKLSLCRVDDGAGGRQIVCGAQNFKAGDKVPLVLPGDTLPGKAGEPPMAIKVGKIRGVASTTLLMARKPAFSRRDRIQSGLGPILTPRSKRAL